MISISWAGTKNAALLPVVISRLSGASCCHSSRFSGSKCWARAGQSWEAAAQCRHCSSSCNCIPPQSWPFLHLNTSVNMTIYFSKILKYTNMVKTFLESSYKWMFRHWGTHLHEEFPQWPSQLYELFHHIPGSSCQKLWCSKNTSWILDDLQHRYKYTYKW